MGDNNVKNKYDVLDNAVYHWREQFQREPLLAISVLLLALVSTCLPFFNACLPKIVLKGLEEHLALAEYVTTILILVCILAMANMVKSALTSYVNRMQGPFIDAFNLRILKKRLRVDYGILESKKFNEEAHAAYEALYRNRSVIRNSSVIWQQLLTGIASLLLYGFIVIRQSLLLASLVVIPTVAVYILKRKVYIYEQNLRITANDADRKMRYFEEEVYDFEAGKDIRLYDLGGWIFKIINGEIKRGENCVQKWENGYMSVSWYDAVLCFLRDLGAYIYFIFEIVSGNLPVSDFVWYMAIISNCQQACTTLLQCIDMMERLSFDYTKIRNFFESNEENIFMGEKKGGKEKSVTIQLENVSYTYPGNTVPTLAGLNLTLHAGEKVALVGLNGAGKSTLVKLLCGLYQKTTGEIYINGKPIEKYNKENYFELIAAVFQDVQLLPLTIAQNVASQDEGQLNREKIKESLKLVGLWKKVEQLPLKENTPLKSGILNEGVDLSGGEKQKLWMARAFYKGTPFLVLDEPTAALDPLAEQEIYEKYAELSAMKTSLFISHRLASTQFCDRILLLEDGKIIEEGTHEALIQKNGVYAKLFDMQGKYYRKASGKLAGEE